MPIPSKSLYESLSVDHRISRRLHHCASRRIHDRSSWWGHHGPSRGFNDGTSGRLDDSPSRRIHDGGPCALHDDQWLGRVSDRPADDDQWLGWVSDGGSDDCRAHDSGTDDSGTDDAGPNDSGTDDAGPNHSGTDDRTPDHHSPDYPDEHPGSLDDSLKAMMNQGGKGAALQGILHGRSPFETWVPVPPNMSVGFPGSPDENRDAVAVCKHCCLNEVPIIREQSYRSHL